MHGCSKESLGVIYSVELDETDEWRDDRKNKKMKKK